MMQHHDVPTERLQFAEGGIRPLVRLLRQAPPPVLPLPERRFIPYPVRKDPADPASPLTGAYFKSTFSDAYIQAVGGRCEVKTCRASGPKASLRLHHILFRADRGPASCLNAKVLCFQCHQGGHNASMPENPRFCILRSGLDPEVSFAILHALERSRMVKVFREVRSVQADTGMPVRPLVIANRIVGEYAADFHALSDTLQRAVRRAGVQGRLSEGAREIIYRYVLGNVIPHERHAKFAKHLPGGSALLLAMAA